MLSYIFSNKESSQKTEEVEKTEDQTFDFEALEDTFSDISSVPSVPSVPLVPFPDSTSYFSSPTSYRLSGSPTLTLQSVQSPDIRSHPKANFQMRESTRLELPAPRVHSALPYALTGDNILGIPAVDEDFRLLEQTKIPPKFLHVLENFHVPSEETVPMQAKLDQIEDFQNAVVPTLPDTKDINLWNYTERYPFVLQLIELLALRERTFYVEKAHCYRDARGILQDTVRKSNGTINANTANMYEQLLALREIDAPTTLNTDASVAPVKTKYVTKAVLTVLVDELHKDTKSLLEHKQIQHFITSLRADHEAASKSYVTYCNEYSKYDKLKTSLIELSKLHKNITSQIEALNIQKSMTSEQYRKLNESVETATAEMISSIDTNAMANLQQEIVSVAGRYHYLKGLNAKALRGLNGESLCGSCGIAERDATLECGHQGCVDCLTKSDFYCSICHQRSTKLIKLHR